jgi:hypothetical protein
MGRHLFILGLVLELIIVVGFVAAAIIAVYLIRTGHPWWVGVGAGSITLVAEGAALRPIAKILGPEGVTGIIKQRNNSPVAGLSDPTAEREQPPSSAS